MPDTESRPGKRPLAYSYVRFSNSKQELGDSLRRQVEMAEAYCAKNGLELHPVSYRDLGVSAFKRKNIERGALYSFISAVKNGKIPVDSYLVVEQFDRVTRADVDVAIKLLLDLVHSGIKLVTLVDEKVWDRDSVKDVTNLMVAIIFMSRANNESAMKADRLRHVWDQKQKKAAQHSGLIVTSECPRWLRAKDDKTGFMALPERVESVRRIFEMYIGGYGAVAIATRANKEMWPVPGRGETWHSSLVHRILNNRALLGEYQPNKLDEDGRRIPVGDPIPNYYPAVLEEETFLRARAVAGRKGKFPGRRDMNFRNLLQGLLKCSCGHSMVRKNKASAKQPGYARYYCSARVRGLSRCEALEPKLLETAVMRVVSVVAPAHFNGTGRVAEMKSKVEILSVDIQAARERRDRYADAIGQSKTSIPALLERLFDAERSVAKLEQEQAGIRAQLAEQDTDFETVFENLLLSIKSRDSMDARASLREDLARIIEKIDVFTTDGYIRVHFRGEKIPVIQPLRPDAMIPGVTAQVIP